MNGWQAPMYVFGSFSLLPRLMLLDVIAISLYVALQAHRSQVYQLLEGTYNGYRLKDGLLIVLQDAKACASLVKEHFRLESALRQGTMAISPILMVLVFPLILIAIMVLAQVVAPTQVDVGFLYSSDFILNAVVTLLILLWCCQVTEDCRKMRLAIMDLLTSIDDADVCVACAVSTRFSHVIGIGFDGLLLSYAKLVNFGYLSFTGVAALVLKAKSNVH